MIEIEVMPRKWGNSFGCIIPKDVVKRAKLRLHRGFTIIIPEQEVNLSDIFGALPIKASTQKLLDEARKGER